MLSSKFSGTARALRSESALTDQELMQVAPSIFADGAHESRSERYAHIPTIDVLDGLRKEGFHPFFVTQARVRIAGKVGFAKHMLRLRHESFRNAEEVNEIILLNSHDGSSSYQMLAGCFRFVCSNGLIVGDCAADIRIRHKGDVIGDVIEGAYHVVENLKKVEHHKKDMKKLMLPQSYQEAYAAAALQYKFTDADGHGHIPLTPAQVLQPRRHEDDSDSLWATFNRVQENLTKGGLIGTTKKGKTRKTRAVTGIDADVKLNSALWTLSEKILELAS